MLALVYTYANVLCCNFGRRNLSGFLPAGKNRFKLFQLKQVNSEQLTELFTLETLLAYMKKQQEYLVDAFVHLTAVTKAEITRRDRTISNQNETISDLRRQLNELKSNRDLKRKAHEEQLSTERYTG